VSYLYMVALGVYLLFIAPIIAIVGVSSFLFGKFLLAMESYK
jgi:hypothetical protein